MGTLSRMIIAAAIVVSFTGYADAQYMAYRFAGHSQRETPEVNNLLSARYDHLLQVSPRFRTYRMWKECHTINFSRELHLSCLGSFDQYTPILYR